MLKQMLLSIAIISAVLPLTACDDKVDVVAVLDTPTQNITELAAANSELSILTAALKASDLDKALMAEDKKFTVFAPNDEAFMTLVTKLNMNKAELLADKALLTKILSYHVVPDAVYKEETIPFEQPIKTLNGQTISIKEVNAIIDANGDSASILESDNMATNGVVHVINEVLMPVN